MEKIKHLYFPNAVLKAVVQVPFSKSESNRLLILQALSEGKIELINLSDATDTKILQDALASKKLMVDIDDAGTAMRFLTAYFAIHNEHKILDGSKRMRQRPIGDLAEALIELGFRVSYLAHRGSVPLEILPININSLGAETDIDGSISSQFVSALMLIGAALPKGLTIHISNEIVSKPYILLTAELIRKCGIECQVNFPDIHIPHQSFTHKIIHVGGDWTNAGYWYAFAALSKEAEIIIEGLDLYSAQGDKVIAEWGTLFGVSTSYEAGNVVIRKEAGAIPSWGTLHFDFTHHPDLAQTIIVLCAGLNVDATFTGLASLRLKETDRLSALYNELLKFGIELTEDSENHFSLNGTFQTNEVIVDTYDDHRMAMAFAPLSLLTKISVNEPDVVGKSYPSFWEEVGKLLLR